MIFSGWDIVANVKKKVAVRNCSWKNTASIVLNATTAPISKSRWILRISLLSESQENLPNDLSYAEASAEVEKSSFFIIVYPENNRRNIMEKRRFFQPDRLLDI